MVPSETKIERVVTEAKSILGTAPNGLRFSELLQSLRNKGLDYDSLETLVQWLPQRNPEIFSKPSRGLFVLTANVGKEASATSGVPVVAQAVGSATDAAVEQKFYDSYLMHDLDECTRAVAVGGNSLGGKWGTPDVIGVTLPRPRDIYKAPLEIVSAEIKVATGKELITAFGQACSYQLFSHKTYVVVPKSSNLAELDRLESLCQVFGIGLIVFDGETPSSPNYSIRVRASRRQPDSFYVNETLNHKLFDDLLGYTPQ
jgi:hypothetical protein